MRQFSRILAGTAMFVAARANGQAPGFGVRIAPTILSRRGDTITVSYVVHVAIGARDSLASFMVDAPGVVTVEMPGPKPTWWVGSRWQKRPVASWGKNIARPKAGDALPALKYTAVGLPGIVQYWAEAELPLDSVITEEPPDSTDTADTTVTIKGSHGWTLGVTALPADRSAKALLERLSGLLDRMCELGWIDRRADCDDYHPRLRAHGPTLLALIASMTAQRGRHVNDAAFWILSENIRYLLAKL